jgi:hypothetical protein
MEFSDVVLGLALNDEPKFAPSYGLKRTTSVINKLYNIGVNVHLMAWMHRDAVFVHDCITYLSKLALDTGADSILLDCEKDWHNGSVDPSTVIMHGILQNHFFRAGDFDLGVTGLSFLHPTVKHLAEVCDYVIPQAYSIWKPGKENHWSHSDHTEPYYQQRKSYDDWSACEKPIILGLSNYWASRPKRMFTTSSKHNFLPKMSTEESLKQSISGAFECNVDGIAYWSLKWFSGKGKNKDIARRVFMEYFK